MKHFSMLRSFHTADLFTIANGCCGIVAVFLAMRFLATQDGRSIYLAASLVPVAIVFDVLDGRVARWRHRASPMGRELDSLADLISFGVAPASIAYAVGLRTPLDQILLVYFVLCGLSRLARYNITAAILAGEDGKVPYFEGTPIPTSVIPLALLVTAYRSGQLLPATVPGRPLPPDRRAVRRLRQLDVQQDAAGAEAVRRSKNRYLVCGRWYLAGWVRWE